MTTVCVTKILNELYELAKSSNDEQVKLKAYSMILSEFKSQSYQNIMGDTFEKIVNTYATV